MNSAMLGGVFDGLTDWFNNFVYAISTLIPKLFYLLITFIFNILDVLQVLVRRVAGLDAVWYTTSPSGGQAEKKAGDIVYTIIQSIFSGDSPVLANIFWAMIILGVIILFLTTLIAVIRSEYVATTDAQSASKGKIIGQAFKAIASFVIVPITCYFGIFLANTILQALDTITAGSPESAFSESYSTGEDANGSPITSNIATRFKSLPLSSGSAKTTYISYSFYGTNSDIPTSTTPISGLIFKSSAYRANRIRTSSEFYSVLNSSGGGTQVGAGVFNLISSKRESTATLLDSCFANNYALTSETTVEIEPFSGAGGYLRTSGILTNDFAHEDITFQNFDKNDVQLVWYYYDLWSFDFLLCVAALVVALKLLVALVFGLMKRIFEVVVLFLIAPPLAGIMPLDGGAALKKWREKFIGKVLGAYGPIVGLNLLFVVLPIVETIKFFNIPYIDYIVNLFFLIVGLVMVKDLVGTISELIGADNSLKAGSDMASEVGTTVSKVAKVGAAMTGTGLLMKAGQKVGGRIGDSAKANWAKRNDRKAERNFNRKNKDEAMAQFDTLAGQETDIDSQIANTEKVLARTAPGSSAGNAQKKTLADLKAKKASIQNQRASLESNTGWTSDKIAAYNEADNFGRKTILKQIRSGMSSEQKGTAHAWAESAEGQNYGKAVRRAKWLAINDDGKVYGQRAVDNKMAEATNYISNKGLFRGKARLKDHLDIDVDTKGLTKAAKKRIEESRKDSLSIGELQAARDRKSVASQERNNARMQTVGQGILKGGKDIGEIFKQGYGALSGIFGALGGDMAKGFKDAGGFGGAMQTLAGRSEKQISVAAETKNQKKILAAQREAQRVLDAGKTVGGPSEVKLNTNSIDTLANAIASKINPKS